MATFRSIGAYQLELTKLATELGREDADRIAKLMGERARAIARSAASADLGGDPKFSGWAPPLDTQLRPTNTPGIVLITPTRSSAGPWTVAQQGRNRGHQGFAGPGVNNRTGLTSRTKGGGVRQVRSFSGKAKRYNGVTAGKNTATDARVAMERELPKIAEVEFRKVLAKHFDVS